MLELAHGRRRQPSPAPAAAGLLMAGLGLAIAAGDWRADGAPASAGSDPARIAHTIAGDALPGSYPARVVRVLDGDTFEAVVRVWFGQDVTTRVRIRNVDAPELKSQCAAEARLAQSAREALADVLASGPVTLHDLGLDKYGGRIVASVSVAASPQSPENVAAMLVAGGYARAYDGRKRQSWCALRG
ncbi:MAG: hypothetical protein JWN93_691 [Hyphomicrobiales bacterium]|nr:hypothetical protein [Hyphomicrobiales bacterium]